MRRAGVLRPKSFGLGRRHWADLLRPPPPGGGGGHKAGVAPSAPGPQGGPGLSARRNQRHEGLGVPLSHDSATTMEEARRVSPLSLAERVACGGKPRVPFWVGYGGKRGLGAKRAQGIRHSFSGEKVGPDRAHFLAPSKPTRWGRNVLGWFWLWLFQGKPRAKNKRNVK